MNIKLSPLISDGMILQRNANIKIRGFCNPYEFTSISFGGKTVTAKADENGFWLCEVGEFAESSNPQEMKISSSGEEVIIRDILIGDVWLCSGQSNMELMLNRVHNNYPEELQKINPLIRQFKVPQVYNFNEPVDEFALTHCLWETLTPETAENFTAVGYFFAKKLQERYNIPVGLFACAVGGTPVAAWMSRETLADLGLTNELSEAEKCKDREYIEKTITDFEKEQNDYNKSLEEADTGFKENWKSADFNDSEWEEISLCKNIDSGTGAYWYRKTLEIPETLWGKPASMYLGTAIDADEVFVNGESIGQTFYRYPPREYNFTMPEGKLTIAIRLLCTNGNGGFTKGKNHFIATDTRTINIDGIWKRRLSAKAENSPPYINFNYKPTGLYNGMVSPLMNTAVKGVIWYQGESDTGNPSPYAGKLTAMINGWRKSWGIENLPFLMTQIAHYDDAGNFDFEHTGTWEKFREQQKLVLELPQTGLALCYDLGEHNDLHPQNKRDIGERLARLAVRIAYGEKHPPNLFEMYNC